MHGMKFNAVISFLGGCPSIILIIFGILALFYTMEKAGPSLRPKRMERKRKRVCIYIFKKFIYLP